MALVNPRVVYGLLFRTARETLQQIAADSKHVGARIGSSGSFGKSSTRVMRDVVASAREQR